MELHLAAALADGRLAQQGVDQQSHVALALHQLGLQRQHLGGHARVVTQHRGLPLLQLLALALDLEHQLVEGLLRLGRGLVARENPDDRQRLGGLVIVEQRQRARSIHRYSHSIVNWGMRSPVEANVVLPDTVNGTVTR